MQIVSLWLFGIDACYIYSFQWRFVIISFHDFRDVLQQVCLFWSSDAVCSSVEEVRVTSERGVSSSSLDADMRIFSLWLFRPHVLKSLVICDIIKDNLLRNERVWVENMLCLIHLVGKFNDIESDQIIYCRQGQSFSHSLVRPDRIFGSSAISDSMRFYKWSTTSQLSGVAAFQFLFNGKTHHQL